MRILSREQQRQKQAKRLMTAIGLECHLRNLIRKILKGDSSKLVEFQQFVQYAPSDMRTRLLEIENYH